ncbi:MAG: DUF1634 domain-containing protein [Vicinamibacterales bacterium]
MTDSDLDRLEHRISRVLKTGVALSCATLSVGLVLWLFDVPGHEWLLRAGLVILIGIPVSRIVASFLDSVRRGDRLLAWSTAIVLTTMAITLLYTITA